MALISTGRGIPTRYSADDGDIRDSPRNTQRGTVKGCGRTRLLRRTGHPITPQLLLLLRRVRIVVRRSCGKTGCL